MLSMLWDRSRLGWKLTIHLAALFALFFFSWPAFFVFIFSWWLSGCLGICLGYHRYLSHRGFETSKPVAYALVFLGCLAGQGGPIGWVATHRYHHSHTDTPEDVHSPLKGFFWAHMGWLLSRKNAPITFEELKKYAPDLTMDPMMVFLNRFHMLPVFLLALLLYQFGGWPYVLWGIFVSECVSHHTTWSINSVAHIWGYRTFETNDLSRNNWWLALLTFGEGWHNNHHAFPRSARHGLKWWELDVTYWTLRLLETTGLAKNIQTPADLEVLGSTKSS